VELQRRIAGVVAGTFVLAVVVVALEWLAQRLFPASASLDLSSRGALARSVSRLPLGTLLLVAASWVAGPYAGGAVARRIGGCLPALVVTAVGLAGIVLNALAIPHPPWMLAVGVIGVCTVGWRFLSPALSFGP
jgi:hypothetical protein